MNTEKSILARLRRSETGCLLWTGYVSEYGYGVVSFQGKMHRVHRLVYTFLVGPIPEGLTLDHRRTCPKHCAEPKHLEPVTHVENVLRGDSPSGPKH